MKKILFILMGLNATCEAQNLLSGMPVPNNGVEAIVRVDSIVYIGGGFTEVNGQPRNHLASFNANTGVLTSWAPDLSGSVNGLKVVGNKLVAGGLFYHVNAQVKPYICMFDLTTGNLESWTDTADEGYYSSGIGVSGNYFYYAKRAGAGHYQLRCVDATTGNYTAWQSDSLLSGGINSIHVSQNYVYVGGIFALHGTYDYLCRFDRNTGALDLNWHPQPYNGGSEEVNSITEVNSQVFVCGDFVSIAGQSRTGLAAFNENGALSNFNVNTSSSQHFTLFPGTRTVWLNGNFHTCGSYTRWRVAEIDIAAQQPTCWDGSFAPSPMATPFTIFVAGDTVYEGKSSASGLYVFVNSPRPHPGPLTGPVLVNAFQTATYHVPAHPGHTYTWTVVGGTGTSSADTISITWNSVPTGIVSLVENNPSGINCESDTISLQVAISTGTAIAENFSSESFILYPNPADYSITINKKISAAGRIDFIDAMGITVLSEKIVNNASTIVVKNLAGGIYLARLTTGHNSILQKLLIQHP